MPGKRKYDGSSYGGTKKARTQNRYYARPTRGFTRTGGFYGRFRPLWRRRRGYGMGLRNLDYPERKFFDVATNGNIVSTGTIHASSLNLVSLGNAQNNMLGRKINIKRISITGIVITPTDTDTALNTLVSFDQLRFYLIMDLQANGAAATIANIFTTTGINTFMNLENSNRFKILKEWLFVFNGDPGHDGTMTYFSGSKNRFFKYSKKCDIRIDYGAQAGGSRAITEVRSNNLLLCGFSLNGSIAVSSNVRIRFTDE